jgi:hypothetical protein
MSPPRRYYIEFLRRRSAFRFLVAKMSVISRVRRSTRCKQENFRLMTAASILQRDRSVEIGTPATVFATALPSRLFPEQDDVRSTRPDIILL